MNLNYYEYRFDKLDEYIKNYGQPLFSESSNLLIYSISVLFKKMKKKNA